MKRLHTVLHYLIALVWIVNGLYCKVLHGVPRHEQIVERILGGEYAHTLTVLIGFSEILIGVWVLSGIKARWNAIAQMVIVATMNCMEFILAPDLLLWGKANAFFAFFFILVVYYDEFVLKGKIKSLS